MPKKVHRHSIHLSPEMENLLTRRSAHYPSMNAYFEHCLRLENEVAGACKKCSHKVVAESVETILREMGVMFSD